MSSIWQSFRSAFVLAGTLAALSGCSEEEARCSERILIVVNKQQQPVCTTEVAVVSGSPSAVLESGMSCAWSHRVNAEQVVELEVSAPGFETERVRLEPPLCNGSEACEVVVLSGAP